MIWLKAILLGIIQGFTEFLPVSSSGHLVLARHWFGLENAGVGFDVLLHLGTMFAIVGVYHRDLVAIAASLGRVARGSASPPERTLLVSLVVGVVPIAVVGVMFRDGIEAAFGSPRLAAAMLLVTATLLLLSHRARHGWQPIQPRSALWVGLAQVVALLPGISRSGSTISTGMFVGVRPDEAARFSFLMAAPLFLGAAALELPSLFEAGGTIPPGALVIGFLTSFVTGYLAIRWLLRALARGRFVFFGIYCAIIGVIGLVTL